MIPTPQNLVARLIDIFPAFTNEWDGGASCRDDTGQYSWNSIFFVLAPVIHKLLNDATPQQVRSFCALINDAVAQGGGIGNAVDTGFLEHASQIGVRKIIKPQLSTEAKNLLR